MLNKVAPLASRKSIFICFQMQRTQNQAITEDVVNVAHPESTLQVTGLVPSTFLLEQRQELE